jgi:predicted GIY-YIG superfamily endonuclease
MLLRMSIIFKVILNDIMSKTQEEPLTCYCIQNVEETRTYVGATNCFTRRIRQHNAEISGGAQSTKGWSWKPIILVRGFPTRHDLLRFEWLWKHSKNFITHKSPMKRIEILNFLLSTEEFKGYSSDMWVETTPEIAGWISCENEIKELSM